MEKAKLCKSFLSQKKKEEKNLYIYSVTVCMPHFAPFLFFRFYVGNFLFVEEEVDAMLLLNVNMIKRFINISENNQQINMQNNNFSYEK